ncbi:MAG: glycoside hydrolase family 3 C-terminal domain-containing protein, partial [Verrucomicrobiota bacterium]
LKERLLSEADLDDKAERIVRVLLEYGQAENGSSAPPDLIDSPEHRAIALEVAEESIVLLKNKDSILPLDSNSIRRLLVIGPNAAEARLGGGGSASVTPFYSVGPLEGIREACLGASVEVEYLEGCSLIGTMRPIQGCFESVNENGQWLPGLKAEFFNRGQINHAPDATWIVPEVNFSWGWASPGPGVQRTDYGVRFSGRINPAVSGHYRLGVFAQEGYLRMSLDGKGVVNEWPDEGTFEDDYQTRYSTLEYEFKAGTPVAIVIEYGKRAARGAIRIEWEVPGMPDPLQEAARLAGSADAVVVCAGLSSLFEGGSHDRTSIELPVMQQRLIEVMSGVNPRTVVVLFNGGPLAMPWEPEVPAILEAWYPGQEGGRALGRIIFGDINPSGKLPDTVACKLQDHAAAKNYPGDGDRVTYKEGLSVGYRHFDTAGIEPHYPFGFGLSYTTFEISKPELNRETAAPGDLILVSATVKNTGQRAGKETVQLYIRPVKPPVPRPEKELRGFQKVKLQPGEQTEVLMTIGARDLAYYDLKQGAFVVAPGQYEILVGSHSRALKGTILTITRPVKGKSVS